MFIGLQDFDIDIFLRLNDEGIFIYYSDFESVPNIAKSVPLGSFDSEGKLPLTALDIPTRIEVGLEFLHRDLFAEYDKVTRGTLIRVDRFLDQFYNIPEVVDFFDKYLLKCETDNPASWCTTCTDPETRPPYYSPDYDTCAISVPIEEFITTDPITGQEDTSDLYFLIIVYFNGIYRTSPQNAQEFGIYNVLTDIDFEINKYSMILNIKEFFTKEFIYFLKCIPGSIPFANDYGTEIKLAVQTKNFIVRQLEVQAEIQFFITKFNQAYGDLVFIKDIQLQSRESDVGADSWLIEVYADIQQDRLVYRLEI